MRNLIKKITNKITNKNQQMKAALMTLFLTIVVSTPAFAAPNIGQNASTWFLEQIFWVIIIVAFILAAKEYNKGNTMKTIGVVVLAGVLLVLVKNPTTLENFGSWVLDIFGVR